VSKHFFYEYKLDHPWFSGRFNFFLTFFKYYIFFGLLGCVAPESHKSALYYILVFKFRYSFIKEVVLRYLFINEVVDMTI
jgi:hypothetical protein